MPVSFIFSVKLYGATRWSYRKRTIKASEQMLTVVFQPVRATRPKACFFFYLLLITLFYNFVRHVIYSYRRGTFQISVELVSISQLYLASLSRRSSVQN